ncbi:MAG: iron-containing alcohol dehydrogenase family protein [Acidimicrobiales bacterium]
MSPPVRSVHTGFAQRLVFGPQTVDDAPAVVKDVGGRRVLVVTTTGRLASDAGQHLLERLGRVVSAVFDGATSHVPTSAVEAAVGVARSAGIDGVVSFGGGSCADLGKAVCWFLEREAGTPGTSFVDRPGVAHVSIPTTYSGAEVTPFFGMTDVVARRKTGAGGPTTAPLAAIYDPVLTLDVPSGVSAETGMNALAHGVECAYSPHRSPEAEALALESIRIISSSLPDVIDDPYDIDARTRMLRGAMLAGRSLQNATMGVHHGLAQLLGGRTGIGHGLANALVLSHAVRFNAEAVPDEAARIGEALGDPGDPAGAIDRLRERLGLPARLAECGVTVDDLDAVARMSSGSPSVQANPRAVSEDDARAILAAAY